jgi:hypothetical protein
MTKNFKHRYSLFAGYKPPLLLFCLRCAEGLTVPYVPDMVHSFTTFSRSSLDKFELFQIMRELIQLGDQQLDDARSFVSRQITGVQKADKVIYVGSSYKSVHWTPRDPRRRSILNPTCRVGNISLCHVGVTVQKKAAVGAAAFVAMGMGTPHSGGAKCNAFVGDIASVV